MSNYHLKNVPVIGCPVPPCSVNGINNTGCIVDSSLYDALCPVNPVTGHRDSMLSRLFSDDVSDTEKQLILSQLSQVKGYSSPSELSDSDILSIIPSRYMNDPVEMERYREYVDDLISENERLRSSASDPDSDSLVSPDLDSVSE